jgi:hypothetical protein
VDVRNADFVWPISNWNPIIVLGSIDKVQNYSVELDASFKAGGNATLKPLSHRCQYNPIRLM